MALSECTGKVYHGDVWSEKGRVACKVDFIKRIEFNCKSAMAIDKEEVQNTK
jgi:hypothetical protein